MPELPNGSHIISLPDGRQRAVRPVGRVAELAERLAEAGKTGVTAKDFAPGVRVSAFVHRSRPLVPIVMTPEAHGGQFKGWHGRWRLADGVRLRRIAQGQP